MEDAISKLDERERRILALRFFQGKTQMEVSAEVGISQAQVSRLEKNALNRIRKNCKEKTGYRKLPLKSAGGIVRCF